MAERIFINPYKLVEDLKKKKGITSIKIKCLGMMPYSYENRNGVMINVGKNDLMIVNTMMTFPIDYIEEVSCIADNQFAGCKEKYNDFVIGFYFKKFLAADSVYKLGKYEWARRNNKIEDMLAEDSE